ncbi:hypothetical protein TNCV_2680441 [Trichonephila clavipes]|uniref:Uncharacterized protein n=1 Tax=Trichonephila clavipes TaxID=2585209 RepID=A0A8X6S7R9_TRICX|nr:hypothetical protein TNCV_2680441 [Trichonephila clavipes]
MGHVLFRDDSKCTRQNDSHPVFTWRENGACFHPPNVTKIDRFGVKRILVCGSIMLDSRTTLKVFDACTVNSQCHRNQIL